MANFDIQEVNNLLNDPASVSLPIKLGAIVIIFGLSVLAGYKLVIVEQLDSLESVKSEEEDRRRIFEIKQSRANQLPAYKAQLAEMQATFGALKDQLPSDTEIPGLILDISEKGLSNGLKIELFKPLPEIHKEFFAEKPIQLEAKGSYNELAGFVSDLSALPRIVTINEIHLTTNSNKTSGSKKPEASARLSLNATIKTYRYLNDEEIDESGENKG